MSKKWKRKTCVYCGAEGKSDTKDHILARQFVLERHRGYLPAVPACTECNNRKSALESELVSLLPFGGRHADASEQLEFLVGGRLERNERLRSKLSAALTNELITDLEGRTVERTMVIYGPCLDRWVEFLTLGLIAHHFQQTVAGKVVITPSLLSMAGEIAYAPIFRAKGHRVPPTSIGGGALYYQGTMSLEQPLASVWRMAFFGGIHIGGEEPHLRGRTYYVEVKPLPEAGPND